MSSNYITKVMRPVNLKGMAAVKESLDRTISDVEKNGDTGEVTITALVKNGSIMSVRHAVSKTIPVPDSNN